MNTIFACSIAFFSFLFAQTNYNVTLFGHLNLYENSGKNFDPMSYSDYSAIWGWTSTSGKEYAIIGTTLGTSIVDISSSALQEVSLMPGPYYFYKIHEFKTYQHYLYIGSEGTDLSKRAGLQIVDLSTLPDSATFIKVFGWIDTLTGINYYTTHTVSIENNFLYLNGGLFGGTRILDISDPINPLPVGSYGKGVEPYVHDSFIRNDTLYAASLSAGLHIVDVTAKGHYNRNTIGKVISKTNYPNNFTHNVWLSDDGNFAFTTDEQMGGHLRIWDITNRATPVQIAEWSSDPNASIHNVFVKEDFLYVAYYTEGFRVLDIKNPHNPIEVAFYDTYTLPNLPLFAGAWGVYPYFPSGKIAVSDMNTGLYVFNVDLKYGGNVTGVVRDALTNQPIENVEIAVQETGRKFFTDINGRYTYGNASGSHSITFSKEGYGVRTEPVITKAGIVDTFNIALSPLPLSAALNNVIPVEFSLSQNYPNPFNPVTRINYGIPQSSFVTLYVYDVLGRKVAELVNQQMEAGAHSVPFDAAHIPSGVYVYRLTAGTHSEVRTMTVIK